MLHKNKGREAPRCNIVINCYHLGRDRVTGVFVILECDGSDIFTCILFKIVDVGLVFQNSGPVNRNKIPYRSELQSRQTTHNFADQHWRGSRGVNFMTSLIKPTVFLLAASLES